MPLAPTDSGTVAGPSTIARRFVWGVVALWSVGLLVADAVFATRFLDFFDESYWLTLTRDPDASRAGGEIFLFQFVLHPVLETVGEDIVLYRWVGLAVIVGAVLTMVGAAWRVTTPMLLRVPRPLVVGSYLLVPAAATTVHAMAGRVPGYRSIAFVGLCLLAAGTALALSHRRALGGLLAGVAAVLVFTGRPTSAVAGALLALVAAWAGGARVAVFLAGAAGGTVAAIGGVCLLSGMTPTMLVEYLRLGYEQVAAGGSYTSLLDILGVAPSPMRSLLLFGPVLLAPVVLTVVGVQRRRPVSEGVALLAGVGAAALVTVFAVVALTSRDFGAQVLPLTMVVFLVTVVAGVRAVADEPDVVATTARPVWALVALLLVLPYVAALGTNTRYVYNMAQASGFWALGLVLVLALLTRGEGKWATAPLSALLLVLGTTSVLQVVSFTNGGPGDSVVSAGQPVRVMGGTLGVNADDARVLDQLARVRDEYGLVGQPSVDLTGFASGYQLQLGTRPLGRASFFGFFEGAARGAERALARESCRDRASAWLLQSPGNPMDLSSAFAHDDLDLESDYDVVTSFHPTQGPREWRSYTIRVLRPRPSVAVALGCGGAS